MKDTLTSDNADAEETSRLLLPGLAPSPEGETAGGPALAWRMTAASWVGLVRRQNQDSACTSPYLAGVADGMGGEAAGDLASMVAARQLWLAAATEPQRPLAEVLAQVVRRADADIAELVRHDSSLDGMGTTICAAMFDGHQMAFVHIGDSRAYQWRGGALRQLTHDHSFVQQLIDQGHLTPEEARHHPKRSLVLRIVNGSPLSRPDQFDVTPQLGDRYLLCSDGLSSYVSPADLTHAMRQPDLEVAVDELLEAAEAAGAPDNVTLVLADIIPAGQAPVTPSAPRLWGAAAALTPPAQTADSETGETADEAGTAGIATRLGAWGIVLPESEEADDDDDKTPAPAPTRRPARPRRRLWRRLVVAVVVLAVIAGGLLGGRAWLHAQYFLGVVDGRAAIFQGVPYRVGPWYLSSVEQTSSVSLADLPVYYADMVRTWQIRPASLEDARLALAELQAKADICIAARYDPTVPAAGDCP